MSISVSLSLSVSLYVFVCCWFCVCLFVLPFVFCLMVLFRFLLSTRVRVEHQFVLLAPAINIVFYLCSILVSGEHTRALYRSGLPTCDFLRETAVKDLFMSCEEHVNYLLF